MTGSSIFDYVHHADHTEMAEQLGLGLSQSQNVSSPNSAGSEEGSSTTGTNNPDGKCSKLVLLFTRVAGFLCFKSIIMFAVTTSYQYLGRICKKCLLSAINRLEILTRKILGNAKIVRNFLNNIYARVV